MTTTTQNQNVPATQEQVEVAATLSSIVVGAASLAEFKEALAKQSGLEAIAALPTAIQTRAQIEGIYRLFSAETAGKGDKIMEEAAKIAERLERGYWSIRDEKAATQTIGAKTGGKTAKYTRQEILGAIRDNTPKSKLANLKALESWDDEKLLAFFAVQSTKEGSVVYLARVQLEEREAARAKAELDAMLAEFDEVDL